MILFCSRNEHDTREFYIRQFNKCSRDKHCWTVVLRHDTRYDTADHFMLFLIMRNMYLWICWLTIMCFHYKEDIPFDYRESSSVENKESVCISPQYKVLHVFETCLKQNLYWFVFEGKCICSDCACSPVTVVFDSHCCYSDMWVQSAFSQFTFLNFTAMFVMFVNYKMKPCFYFQWSKRRKPELRETCKSILEVLFIHFIFPVRARNHL